MTSLSPVRVPGRIAPEATPAADLAEYLGYAAAAEILRCGRERGWMPRVPARPWRGKGYSDAVLALLNIVEPGGARKVVVKVTPPAPVPGRKTDPYDAAARECPTVFRPHLVVEAEPPWTMAGGGRITFQKLAADDVRACRSLDQLPYDQLVAASGLVASALLLDWNADGLHHNTGGFGGGPPTYADFVARAVDSSPVAYSSIRRYAEDRGLSPDRVRSIRFPDGMVCPNPLYLARPDSPLHRPRLDVLSGRGHGDLHLRNVVVPEVGGRPVLHRFELVDLETYQRHRSLAADPVLLLLSGVARWLPAVPVEQWGELRDAIVRPAYLDRGGAPFDLVRSVYGGTVRAISGLGRGLTSDWTTQFLLTTLATSLSFTTFVDLGARRRGWFFRLAAECGRSVLTALDERVPDDAVPVGEVSSDRQPRAGWARCRDRYLLSGHQQGI
jgi:hypothetical protein